jgi:hypothetical protein
VELWSALVIKGNNLSIDNGVIGEIAERFHQIRIL